MLAGLGRSPIPNASVRVGLERQDRPLHHGTAQPQRTVIAYRLPGYLPACRKPRPRCDRRGLGSRAGKLNCGEGRYLNIGAERHRRDRRSLRHELRSNRDDESDSAPCLTANKAALVLEAIPRRRPSTQRLATISPTARREAVRPGRRHAWPWSLATAGRRWRGLASRRGHRAWPGHGRRLHLRNSRVPAG